MLLVNALNCFVNIIQGLSKDPIAILTKYSLAAGRSSTVLLPCLEAREKEVT